MLPRTLSKPVWCPKSTIVTACCTASQINYWIVFSEFRTMLLGSSNWINSAISHQYWPHYTGSLSIAGLISRSHCWVTKPYMVKPQPISLISCSPTIHPRSCARLTNNSFNSRPVVWNLMVTVRSAVQPQLYGTISPTVWRPSRLSIFWKLNYIPIFIVSQMRNDMWLLFNRDIHWLTVRLERP